MEKQRLRGAWGQTESDSVGPVRCLDVEDRGLRSGSQRRSHHIFKDHPGGCPAKHGTHHRGQLRSIKGNHMGRNTQHSPWHAVGSINVLRANKGGGSAREGKPRPRCLSWSLTVRICNAGLSDGHVQTQQNSCRTADDTQTRAWSPTSCQAQAGESHSTFHFPVPCVP